VTSDKPGPLASSVMRFAGERDAEFRVRVALQRADAVERRRRQLLEQASLPKTPEQHRRALRPAAPADSVAE
jgi:hypothetical protein